MDRTCRSRSTIQAAGNAGKSYLWEMEREEFQVQLEGGAVVAGVSLCSGPTQRLVVAWHGYGQRRSLWESLVALWPAGCRLVLLDLPYFGESAWPEGRAVQPADLDALLRQLLVRWPAADVELVGFSLGAKLALSLYQFTDLPIRRMILISPDGLRIHPVYRFCIYNPVGKSLFYTVLRWPGLFLWIWRTLHRLRITDPFKFRFIQLQFDAPHKRALLARVWQGYAALRPDVEAVARRSSETGTSWHIIWGEGDDVLPVKLCKGFIGKVNGAKLHVLEGGHFLLNPPRDPLKELLTQILHA